MKFSNVRMYVWIGVNNVAAKPDKARGNRPTEGASSSNGLFDDDDEDLFAPSASKPLAASAAASRKGLSHCLLAHHG